MNEFFDQDENREPEFMPDVAYNLHDHRLGEDGIINGNKLKEEITNDLTALAKSDSQISTLSVQVQGASLEEQDDFTSLFISLCKEIEPRIQDIKVHFQDFQGGIQVIESIGEELGKLGLILDKDQTSLTRFALTPIRESFGYDLHKVEEVEIPTYEVQEIEEGIKTDIREAVAAWVPGTIRTLDITCCNTRPMHQETVRNIFNRVFDFELQQLTAKYSSETPPITPNISMMLSFVDKASEIDKIAYDSSNSKDKENNKTDTE